MNKLKKVLAVFISMVILLSTTGAFAAVVTDTSYKKEYTEDFEYIDKNLTEDVEFDKTTGYPNNNYPSDVFENTTTNYHQSNLLVGKGADGGNVLEVYCTGSDRGITTKSLNVTELGHTIAEVSYDLMINSNPTTDKEVLIAGAGGYAGKPLFKISKIDGTYMIMQTDDGSSYEEAFVHETDTWYKVVVRSDMSTRYAWILDENGTILAESTVSDASRAKNTCTVAFVKGGATGASIYIDNAVFRSYDPENAAPSLVSSSVEEDATDVQRNTKLTFTFDQPITDDSVVTLTRADEEAITEITVTSVEKKSYNTLVLNYTGLLDRKTEYVISFEDVSNGSLACADDPLSFTTEDLHIWNDVVLSSAEPNEDNSALTDITFEISEEYGYPTFSGSVMAVVYQNDKMINADIKPLTNAATGELTVSFSLGALPSDRKIALILLDVEDGPVPLAGGTLEN